MPRYAVILIYIIAVLLFQEMVFRAVFEAPEVEGLNRVNYLTAPSQEAKVEYLAYQTLTWASIPDTNAYFEHHLNQYGFRDKHWKIEKDFNKKRVLFIGDSFVEGTMVNNESSIPSLYQSKTGQDVMNAGMIGVGLEAYLNVMKDLLPIYEPDEVFLVLYANDISNNHIELGNREVIKKRSNFEPRLYSIFKQMNQGIGILHSFKDPQAFWPAVPNGGNVWTTREKELSQHVVPEIADYMKKGDLNPYRTNWVLTEEAHLKQFRSIIEPLKVAKNICRVYKAKLRVVYIPSRHQVSNYYFPFEKAYCQVNCPETLDMTVDAYQVHRKQLLKDCQALRLSFLDTYDWVKAKEDKGLHLYWNYDDHMRSIGYQTIVDAIHESFN